LFPNQGPIESRAHVWPFFGISDECHAKAVVSRLQSCILDILPTVAAMY